MSKFVNNVKERLGLRAREALPQRGYASSRLITTTSGFSGKTGIHVTPETSLTMSAIYSAVTLLSNTCSPLPIELHEIAENGDRKEVYDLFTYIINYRPNTEQNKLEFMEQLVANMLLRGNAYCEKEYNEAGEVINYWPIPAQYITPLRMDDYSIWYAYIGPTGQRKLLPSKKILHIKDFSIDGLVGLSRITLGRLSIELGLSQEALGISLMANDAKVSGIIECPAEMSDEDVKAFNDAWKKDGNNLFNKGRTIVLEKGLTFKQISLSPKDSEFILGRQFQIQEIARWFRVPPHKLYDLTRSTYSNINMQSQEFSTDSILPILERFVAAFMYDQYVQKDIVKIIKQLYRQVYELSYNLEKLLNADPLTRHLIYEKGSKIGMYSVNDTLRMEKLSAIGKDGDKRLVMNNMIPLDKVGMVPNGKLGTTAIQDGTSIK